VADAQQWARFFTRRCGVSEKDIRLLTDISEVYTQSDSETAVATKDNIMRALQWLTARSATGDQVFFVFCGHGVQVVAEEFAGNRLCENSIAPTDVGADGNSPRVVSDSEVHSILQVMPSGVQATLIYDSCHAGSPLDRQGLNYLTEHVKRGNVDYEKLKGHPVLPRFYNLAIGRCATLHRKLCASHVFDAMQSNGQRAPTSSSVSSCLLKTRLVVSSPTSSYVLY
jgi:hypothetical protein